MDFHLPDNLMYSINISLCPRYLNLRNNSVQLLLLRNRETQAMCSDMPQLGRDVNDWVTDRKSLVMHGANCLMWRGLEWVIRKRQKYVSLRRVVRGAGLACRRSVASTCVHVPCPWAWTVRPTPARTSSSSPWRRVAPARARRALALAPRLTAARAGPCKQSLPLCTLIKQIVYLYCICKYRPDKSAVRIQNVFGALQSHKRVRSYYHWLQWIWHF